MSSPKASAESMSAAPSATSQFPSPTSDASSTPIPGALQAQAYLEEPKVQRRRSETPTASASSLHDSMRLEVQNSVSAGARSPSSSPEKVKDPQQVPEAFNRIQRSGERRMQRSRLTAEASSTPPSTSKRALQTSMGEPSAKKSSAPSSPQPGRDVDRAPKRKTQKEDASADKASAPTSHDYAKASSVTKGGLHLVKTNEPASGDENITPWKRTKSDIGPWMTQRHKRAIRRSLEAAAPSSSPIKSPAPKSAPAPALAPRKGTEDGDSGERK